MATKRKAAKKAQSGKRRKTAPKRSFRAAMAIATSARKPLKQTCCRHRRSAVGDLRSDKNLQAMLNVLASDKDDPIEVRLAALQALQAASFSVVAFESCRGDYRATLRKVADDPDPELRQRVLGIFMRERMASPKRNSSKD